MGKAKRGNGEGSLYAVERKGTKKWVATVTIGKRPSGGPWVKTFQRNTKRAALAARSAFLELSAEHAEQRPLTLSGALDRWLEDDVRPRCRPRTYQNYESYVRLHIKPVLGERELAAISASDIQGLLYSAASTRGGRLSSTTRLHIYRVLNTAFKQFVRWRLVVTNEVALVRAPSAMRYRPKLWSVEQARFFLDRCVDHEYGPAFGLLLLSGLRISELLGLTWDSVHFDDGYFEVNKTLQRINNEWVFQPTKTSGSYRSVPFAPDGQAATLLRAQADRQRGLREVGPILYGDFTSAWLDRGLVFTTRTGRPLSGKDSYARFQALCRQLGLPKARQHDLRHLFATISLAAGAELKVTSSLLGHSSIAITADTYAHVLDEAKVSATRGVEEMLAPVAPSSSP